MINLNFAPNENFSDAFLSFSLLFQPWRFKKGKEIKEVKNKIAKDILNLSPTNFSVNLFLSGRSTLYFLLKTLKLKEGDEVLVQAFTCEAVILPIIALKLKPVFVDIEKESFSINPIDLQKKLSKKSKVLILQHTFGIRPSQKEKILFLSKQHNLVLIEDIAHGINSKSKSENAKVLKDHYFLLSFGRSKSLSSVFGGAIVSKNKEISQKLNNLDLAYPSYSLIFKLLLYKPIAFIIKRTYNIYLGKLLHFLAQKINLLTKEITEKEKRGEYNPFFNKAYPNALAILLINQLKRFKSTQNQRKKVVEYYLKNLKSCSYSKAIYYPKNVFGALIRFPIFVKNPKKIIKKMAEKGVFLGYWYNWPVAPKGFPLKKVGYRWGNCPTAEKICQQIINLPTNINLKSAKRVVALLNTLNDI